MKINTVYQDPCLETLRKMPDKYLDCVITSPPYWQLRDYGYPEQWGLEPTFNEYLDHLWAMMDLIWLKLKDEGTAWINLGDTYGAGSNKTVGRSDSTRLGGSPKSVTSKIDSTISKCLLLIPHRFAIGCIDRGWIVRNDIIWAKRNGMPESTTDRFSKKHEYFFFMVKQQKYFFDLDAVRDNAQTQGETRIRSNDSYRKAGLNFTAKKYDNNNPVLCCHINGKNPGSVSDFWDIPTKPNSKNHYAVYNDELLRKPILAGCPEFVCKKCGEARRRIVEIVRPDSYNGGEQDEHNDKRGTTRNRPLTSIFRDTALQQRTDKGFTDCGCNAGFEPGIIYDPFMGSGTTAITALRAGRNFIGSEMSKEYCDIANQQVNEFLAQEKLF